jgi:flagellar biosynthesis protein
MAAIPDPKRPRSRAAALQYDPPRDRAPRLVARGEGHVAERILELARAHGIPVQEDPALVDLLARLDVGQEIPLQLYRVVAEVIAFVFRVQRAATDAGRNSTTDASASTRKDT